MDQTGGCDERVRQPESLPSTAQGTDDIASSFGNIPVNGYDGQCSQQTQRSLLLPCTDTLLYLGDRIAVVMMVPWPTRPSRCDETSGRLPARRCQINTSESTQNALASTATIEVLACARNARNDVLAGHQVRMSLIGPCSRTRRECAQKIIGSG